MVLRTTLPKGVSKMKQRLLSLFMVMSFALLCGVAHAVPDPSSAGILKRIKGGSQSTPTRVYVLVRNSDNDQDNAGISSADVVVWDTNSDDGVSVRLTTTSVDGAIAGIAVTAISTGDTGGTTAADDEGQGNWGYVQVYGHGLAKITAGGAGGVSIGNGFVTSADSGAITWIDEDDTSALRNNPFGGFFFDASGATDTQAEVFIKLE
jgi:hypothetical protein